MLQHLHTLTGHQNPVYALTNASLQGIFFSAGNDKGIVEWSLYQLAFLKVKMPVQSSVYVLHYHDNRLFVGERSGAFSVYDFIEQKVAFRKNAHLKPIFDIKTVSEKKELLTASEDGTVAVWSLADLSEVFRFRVSHDTVRSIAISPEQTEIAFACKDNLIRIYHLSDYTLKHTLEAHKMPVTSIAYHPHGKYLISGSRDAQLNVWETTDYKLIRSIPAHMFTVYDIAFHPIMPYFATASQDKSIKLWDAENFKLYKILSLEKGEFGHTHSVNKIIWSSEGEHLISTGDDRKIIIWKFLESN